jgi:hypothetical protein
MGAILVDNNNLTEMKWQPGQSLFYGKDGGITGEGTATIRKELALSGLPPVGAPFLYDTRAFIGDRRITWEEGFAVYHFNIAGTWNSTTGGGSGQVDGQASAMQLPIDCHPNFSTRLANNSAPNKKPSDERGAGAHFNDDGVFDAFIPTATDISGNDIGGTQSYYGKAGTTVRITYAATNGSGIPGLIGVIGTVSSTLVAGSTTLNINNGILFTSISWEEIYGGGGYRSFRITREYLINPEGWNPVIYGP